MVHYTSSYLGICLKLSGTQGATGFNQTASFNVNLGVKYDYSTHTHQFDDEIVMDHIIKLHK